MNTLFYSSAIAAFLLTLLLTPVLRQVAIGIGLVDKPNKRKVHAAPVPLIGGVAVFTATALQLSLAVPFSAEILAYKNIVMAVFIMLIMGVIDDRYDLSAPLKLAIQLMLAHYVYSQGIKIESLYGLFGIYTLAPSIQYGLTVVVIAGAVNAFNLMDGIDGLAAGLAIAGFAVFTVLGVLTKCYTLVLVFLTFTGALLAFLWFNLSKTRKIFMGDAGSLALGFVLVISGIAMLQNQADHSQAALVAFGVIAVLLIPVFDAFRVFRRRIKMGKSPFSADKTHLHHLVLSAGMKHQSATLCILLLMMSATAVGYLGFREAGITVAIILMLMAFCSISRLLQFNDQIKHWKRKIRVMEHRYFEK